MLKAALDTDLTTSALIRWCLADSHNINYSMILSLMQKLIKGNILFGFCRNRTHLLWQARGTSLGAIAAHTVDFFALKLQAQLRLACQYLSPLSVLICVIPFCQRAWIHCKIIPLQGHWRQNLYKFLGSLEQSEWAAFRQGKFVYVCNSVCFKIKLSVQTLSSSCVRNSRQ